MRDNSIGDRKLKKDGMVSIWLQLAEYLYEGETISYKKESEV